MLVSPVSRSRGLFAFSRKPYFHVAEITVRLDLGGLLVAFAAGLSEKARSSKSVRLGLML